MELREFGKTGFKAYPIGFGCMRFPTNNVDGKNVIDEVEAIKMLRHAIDNGMNYVDTAYPYHDGNSEIVVGKALLDGYREKVKLATKLPVWFINSPEDFDKFLAEQMEKLQTDHIDFYLLHALNQDRWENVVLKYDLLKKAEQAKADGRIGNIGFSYHERADYYETILDGYDKWDFTQIQLNYIDGDYQAGLNGLHKAYAKGLGVIIMEPLQGGKLANLPSKINSIFQKVNPNRTEVEWALDYLWDLKEVGFMLSGMSTFKQVEDNLLYANRSSVGMFTNEERQAVKDVYNKFKEVEVIPCTKCGYCMPCPVGIDIPHNFTMINNAHLFETMDNTKVEYKKMLDNKDSKKAAKHCVDCKTCVSKCPQNINIPVELNNVHNNLNI